jgi:hypothetical protein
LLVLTNGLQLALAAFEGGGSMSLYMLYTLLPAKAPIAVQLLSLHKS